MTLSDSDSGRGRIVVAGDVSIDWLAWPEPAVSDVGAANWRQCDGTRMVPRRGGALLLVDLLKAAGHCPIGPDLPDDDLAKIGPKEHIHSLVDLESRADKRFRIGRVRGFCGPPDGNPRQLPLKESAKNADLVVLDDSGNGFRECEAAWKNLIEKADPRWLIVKMARPLATGSMWKCARRGPLKPDGNPDPQRLIVILNAEDLREEKLALSRRLSWERTAEDFVRELGSNGKLDTLVTCANLIVRFGCEGVIHHFGRSAAQPKLFFDPSRAEDEIVEASGRHMIGMTDAFTAGLVAALAEDAGTTDDVLERAIKRGMRAARQLAEAGFRAGTDNMPDYPRVQAMLPATEEAVPALNIPSRRIAAGEKWSILDDQLGDAADAARLVVTDGPKAALAEIPVAKFGDLVTADREEIESYRAISNLLRDYLGGRPTKPISIGVFGPPGAGKSFGVKQVAKCARSISSDKPKDCKLEELEKPLEFNLSQFTKLDDLIAAFHLVRDRALSGVVPLVFFDEFDTSFDGRDLGWLRYFLAPMQDGEFRESGHTHPLGPAIFVFAGGTRWNLKDFVEPMSKPKDHPDHQKFVAAKGPDFASRLRGYIDIRGPNPINAEDRMFPVRRAFQLRNVLSARLKPSKPDGSFAIDDGVLNALLTVPFYRHGSRSIEAVMAMSAQPPGPEYKRSYLPPAEQLEMHVDAADFMGRVRGERLPDDLRDALGRLLHDAYRAKRRSVADNEEEHKRLEGHQQLDKDPAMSDWNNLSDKFRESSRLQADDIPHKLRMINCYMAKESEGRGDAVTKFGSDDVTKLAIQEHERFNAERLRQQWQLGERDPEKRTSPFLVPWGDLDKNWQSVDEAAVIAIPAALEEVGWRVYRRKR